MIFEDILKKSNLKITTPRKLILKALFKAKKPLSVKAIYKQCPGINMTSVYRGLNIFIKTGIASQINVGDKGLLYELLQLNHQHHIVCEKCGEIRKIDFCALKQIEKITKYKITSHFLVFRGKCPLCA